MCQSDLENSKTSGSGSNARGHIILNCRLNPPGLGPTTKNTLKNSLNSCQTLRLLKLCTNISDRVHTK
jgi:hypothetical protein